jgi:hypothetical protein
MLPCRGKSEASGAAWFGWSRESKISPKVQYDSNPRNNMSPGDIARAVRNLDNAGRYLSASSPP